MNPGDKYFQHFFIASFILSVTLLRSPANAQIDAARFGRTDWEAFPDVDGDKIYLVAYEWATPSQPRLSYERAREECDNAGAILATVDSDALQNFLQGKINAILERYDAAPAIGVWIGFRRTTPDGDFMWEEPGNGQVEYDNWADNQPIDDSLRTRAAAIYDGNWYATWRSGVNLEHQFRVGMFVCQKTITDDLSTTKAPQAPAETVSTLEDTAHPTSSGTTKIYNLVTANMVFAVILLLFVQIFT